MKLVRIFLLSVLSIFIAFYLAFLFIMPSAIDLNKYSSKISDLINQSVGVKAEIKGLRLKASWNLSAGASMDRVDLLYSNGQKFAQINGFQIRFSLMPLLLKQFKIDTIQAEKLFLNVDIAQNGKFLIESFLPSKNELEKNKFGFVLSENMPKIAVKKYRISFVDLTKNNRYTIKGENLNISDFVLNKRIKVKLIGDMILNERQQISYDLSVFSEIFSNSRKNSLNILKIFEDIYKYRIDTKVFADLSLKKVESDANIEGRVHLDKLSFVFGGKQFPQSNLKLNFSGSNVKINSSLNVSKDTKAIITGVFNTGKKKSIDLHVISDKVAIDDILLITKAMSKPFGLNNLHNITAKGLLKADFKIKSDFKKNESSGYLKIINASVKDSLNDIILDSINTDVDFSKNVVKINKATARLNNQPIVINGIIDKNAIANISIAALNLKLKDVLIACKQNAILKENEVSGLVKMNVFLNGQLNKIVPKINLVISDVTLKNKKTKLLTDINKINVKANYKANKSTGIIEIVNLKLNRSGLPKLSAPKISANFSQNDLILAPANVFVDNIRTELSGKISDIYKKPRFNNVSVNIANMTSVPIKGYENSKVILKGKLNVNGDISSPVIRGGFDIPLVSIPSLSTSIRNATIEVADRIIIVCPQLQVADSTANLSAKIDKDITKGLIARDVDFSAEKLNLNSIIPAINNLQKDSDSNFTVVNGKNVINKFIIGNIVSTNINSNISIKNNVLNINNITADAYSGKVGGSASYNLKNNTLKLDLSGRGLSASPALIAMTGTNDDINGQLDFDSDISMRGLTKNELLKSLSGNTNFIISNGRMGMLGKLEHLLYAQNIVSNSIFKTTLNVTAKALMVKDTGLYRYMKGKVSLSKGWANIHFIKTSGPSMSLYITGRCYLPDNTANLVILGRISDDVVRILGPIGEFSVNKAISYIPRIGEVTALFAKQYTTNPDSENIAQIPYLSPKTQFATKEFKVIIDGDIRKQTSVKSFKWLAKPIITNTVKTQSPYESQKQTHEVPDFVKNLPDFKN